MSAATEEKQPENRRRAFLAKILMAAGVTFSFGLFAYEWVMFILPGKKKTNRRRIFAGRLDNYRPGVIQNFYDLQGTAIMVKRDHEGIKAFSSVCPHLGCRVHWLEDKKLFSCPCHGATFAENGEPLTGPPADAKQHLIPVPVTVDESSGVVYLEIKDVKPRRQK